MSKIERISAEKAISWAKSFEAVQTLFDRLEVNVGKSEHTIEAYSKCLWKWYKFSNLTPDETVAKWKTEAKADYSTALDEWARLLEKFILWQERELKVGRSTSSLSYFTVKSLLKWNSNLRLTVKSPAKAVQRIIPPITIESFKAAFSVASESQRWLICGLKDSGISREDFVELTYVQVKEALERGEQFIHLDVIRLKTKARYETFLGPNAVEALRAYLKVREIRGEKITDATPLSIIERKPWVKLSRDGLSQTLDRLGKKIGVELSSHRLRKTFETYLALDVKHPLILKYWTGHKISGDIESHYIIPPATEQRKLYENAYKAIDISSGSLDDRARQAAKAEFEKIFTTEQQEFIKKHGTMRFSRKKETPKTECKDGKHCGEDFEQIAESDLLDYLKKGWEIAHKLSNGQVIVKSG